MMKTFKWSNEHCGYIVGIVKSELVEYTIYTSTDDKSYAGEYLVKPIPLKIRGKVFSYAGGDIILECDIQIEALRSFADINSAVKSVVDIFDKYKNKTGQWYVKKDQFDEYKSYLKKDILHADADCLFPTSVALQVVLDNAARFKVLKYLRTSDVEFDDFSTRWCEQYTIDDWKNMVDIGSFIDDDGYGKLSTFDHESNIHIYPSQKNQEFPSWSTHINWYNR